MFPGVILIKTTALNIFNIVGLIIIHVKLEPLHSLVPQLTLKIVILMSYHQIHHHNTGSIINQSSSNLDAAWFDNIVVVPQAQLSPLIAPKCEKPTTENM